MTDRWRRNAEDDRNRTLPRKNRQGEVTLAGTVRDRDRKRRAEDLAERVSGVKDVINALRIVAGVKSGP